MGDVALEIPLAELGFRGLGQRDGAALARVELPAHSGDRAALACGVAAFEQHHHACAGGLDPARHADQFQRQRLQRRLEILALHAHLRPLRFVLVPQK